MVPTHIRCCASNARPVACSPSVPFTRDRPELSYVYSPVSAGIHTRPSRSSSGAKTPTGSIAQELDAVRPARINQIVRTNQDFAIPRFEQLADIAIRQRTGLPIVGKYSAAIAQGPGGSPHQQVAVHAEGDRSYRLPQNSAVDRWIDLAEAYSVEAHQPRRRSQPQIAIARLQNLIYGFAGQAVLRRPGIVAVLIDISAAIERPLQPTWLSRQRRTQRVRSSSLLRDMVASQAGFPLATGQTSLPISAEPATL